MVTVGDLVRSGARYVGARAAGTDTAERTAALLSTASIGASFEPGLLPRSSLDQAVVTGLVSATQYGVTVTSQSVCSAVARRIARDDGTRSGAVRSAGAQAVLGAGVALAGLAVHRLLPQRRGEALRRAMVRNAGRQAIAVGGAAVIVSTAELLDAAEGAESRAVGVLPSAAGLIIGAGVAAGRIQRFRGDAAEAARLVPPVDPLTRRAPATARTATAHPTPLPPVPEFVRAVVIGTAVSTGLHTMALAEMSLTRGVRAAVTRVAPRSGPLATMIGHLATLGMNAAVLRIVVERVNRRAEAVASAPDAAYTTPPGLPTVSGGPASGIPWVSLSREGVRFVNMTLTPDEISGVTGVPSARVATPVRAFAGLGSGPTVDSRVNLVMDDLERLGAFERSMLCVVSPTGSGYVNHVAVEALEYLTRGDCACVALQYSLRPSLLSLDRVAIGRKQNRVLLHALRRRLRSMPADRRPRLVGFGESLGAHTFQDAFLNEGVSGLHRVGMDRALFVGTPASSGWAKRWRLDPANRDPAGEVAEVASWQELAAMPADRRERLRYVLLSHQEDPVTRFEPALLVQRPEWLGPAGVRPPGVSQRARWYPITTFYQTLVDTKNATDVVPGTFVSRGHDYRADLARMVSAVYGLPVDDDELVSIERALRCREAEWARRRLVAEQAQRAGVRNGTIAPLGPPWPARRSGVADAI